MKKFLVLLLVLALVVGAAAAVFFVMKDNYLISKIQKDFNQTFGVSSNFGEVFIDEEKGQVSISQIEVQNVEGFQQPFLAVIKNIELTCDLKEMLFQGNYQCSFAKAELSEFNLEKSLDGKFNLALLGAFDSAKLEGDISVAQRKNSGFLIERLELDIKKATLFENVKGQPVRMTAAKLPNRMEVYGYLSDPAALLYIPTLKAIFGMNRGSLGLPRTSIQQRLTKVTGKFS